MLGVLLAVAAQALAGQFPVRVAIGGPQCRHIASAVAGLYRHRHGIRHADGQGRHPSDGWGVIARSNHQHQRRNRSGDRATARGTQPPSRSTGTRRRVRVNGRAHAREQRHIGEGFLAVQGVTGEVQAMPGCAQRVCAQCIRPLVGALQVAQHTSQFEIPGFSIHECRQGLQRIDAAGARRLTCVDSGVNRCAHGFAHRLEPQQLAHTPLHHSPSI